MSWKRFVLAALVVFVVKAIVGAIAFGAVLDGALDGGSPTFRPEGQERHVTGLVGESSWALAFAWLFTRFARAGGWRDGIRFAALVWSLYFVPMTLGILAYFAVDTRWAVAALGVGLVEAAACGIGAGLVRGTRPALTSA